MTIEPYYSDDHVTLYHGDALELMTEIEADVMVTDPPYGMNYQSNWGANQGANHAKVAGDGSVVARDAVLAMWAQRPALVFGRWSVPRPARTRLRLIWSKAPDPGMGDLSSPWGNSDEEIYVLGSGFRSETRRSNILTYLKPPVQAFERHHPTPKPVELMRDLIACCPPGIILDPFAGSGSTLRAAKDLNRKAIGIELKERYCEIAALRCAQEVLAI